MLTNQLPDHTVVAAHVISAAAILGSFAGILPPLAALGALIWYSIQVWESKTVQGWVTRLKRKSDASEPDQPNA